MIDHSLLRLGCLLFILLCDPVVKVISETSQNPSTLVINQSTMDSAAETTPSSIPSGCSVNTEDDEVLCRNGGTCVGNVNSSKCSCGNLYAGSDCGQLDLNVPIKDVFETGISFIWASEVDVQGFYTVFTRTPLTEESELTIEEVPSNVSDTITINGLQPDNKEYLVCIVHEDFLGNLSNINMSALLEAETLDNTNANCGIAVTPFDQLGPYTLAAWGIAIAIVVILILLLVIRACCDCRHSARREELMATALGKFDFLRKHSSKKKEKENENLTSRKNGHGSAYVATASQSGQNV